MMEIYQLYPIRVQRGKDFLGRTIINSDKGQFPEPTPMELLKFKFDKKEIDEIVNKIVKDILKNSKKVVHGARAINIQVPEFLQRPTEDWDVYSKRAKTDAMKLETLLDAVFNKDFYYIAVQPVLTDNTVVYRVINKATGEAVADFAQKKELPPHIIIDKIRYATLDYLKKKLINILKNPRLRHRWKKAAWDLRRINLAMEYYNKKYLSK